MYIKKEDFSYLETLSKGLNEKQRRKFIESLLKATNTRSGEETIEKIHVVGDEIFDVRGIESGEFMTRTMIKKAYRKAKEEHPE